MPKSPEYENKIITGDCLKVLPKLPEGCADLVFADPPFNIGYDYNGEYHDKLDADEYIKWCGEWMKECYRILKSNGSFFLAIGDDYAAQLNVLATRDYKDMGIPFPFYLRNWIIWHYGFGQNTKKKFARSHTHIFYFVKNPKDFTFNDDSVRVMSDRQKNYADKRAFGTLGKLPDDVWNEFPRVCGSFSEREGLHPCQMPEALLARIVRACSDQDDLIVDPFGGSGTTLAVAKKLDRRYLGIEMSTVFAREIRRRLTAIDKDHLDVLGEGGTEWRKSHEEALKALYAETGVPSERIEKNTYLKQVFCEQFQKRTQPNLEYTQDAIMDKLTKLRKKGQLARVMIQVGARTYKEEHPEQTSSLS